MAKNSIARACAALFLVGSFVAAPAILAADVQSELEALMRDKVVQLAKDKNQDGVPFKRGTYSKNFRKIDESTYRGTFQQDTAGDKQLKTERFLVTFKKDAAGRWALGNQELKDTYEGLQRGIVGDEEFYAFDKASFDREGLKISGTNGFVMKDFFQGKPSRFVLVASDLAYQYAPPPNLDFYQVYRQFLLKDHPEDFTFQTENVRIECVAPSCEELEASLFTGLRKVTLADVDPKLRRFYEDNKKEYLDNLKQNPFLGFRRPPEADRRTYTIFVRKVGVKDHQAWLDYDNYEPREVTVGASGYGELFAYNSEDVRNSGKDPYEIESRPDMDARDYELDSLKGSVELAVEDPETVSGDLTYGITVKRDLKELPFSISRQRFQGQDSSDTKNPRMFINAVEDGSGNELTWVKIGSFGGLVVFPQTLAAGTKTVLKLRFQSQDSIYKLNPSYSYLDRGGWLPLVRFGDMIPDYDLTVSVPAKYKTLGVGKKISEERNGGVITTRWVADAPVSFPTVIFGEYIEDTPSIKATKKDGTEIPVHVYVDKVSTYSVASAEDAAAGSMAIRGSQLKALGDQAVNALNLYREIYGIDYPYSKLDLVNAPFFPGAQAPSSMIYLGSFLFRGEGSMASSGGGSYIAKFLKDTVAHETAHQWWGSRIAMANFRNYWFVESLAEYSSALYVEAVYGRKRYLEKVDDWRQFILKYAPMTSVQNSPSLYAGDDGQEYIANVYNKGPYAFHILRETFGDEKFHVFLKDLAKALDGKEIVTRDMQRVAETSFGVNMDWFFSQWIRGIGLPQYALFYTVRKTEDGKFLVEGKIKQRVVIGPDSAELPGVFFKGLGKLTFVFSNGKEFTYPKPFKVDGPEMTFQLKLPEEPSEVTFNKYGEILAQNVLVNQSW